MCDHCGCRELTPIARLMAEHDRLRELTGQIRTALAAGAEGTARDRFAELLAVLAPHVAREEGALFPVLREEPELAEHVEQLAGEHAAFYDDLDDLGGPRPGTAGDGDWQQGVLALLADLDEHMFKEDFGLFPAALATVDGADWDRMERWAAGRPASAGGAAASA